MRRTPHEVRATLAAIHQFRDISVPLRLQFPTLLRCLADPPPRLRVHQPKVSELCFPSDTCFARYIEHLNDYFDNIVGDFKGADFANSVPDKYQEHFKKLGKVQQSLKHTVFSLLSPSSSETTLLSVLINYLMLQSVNPSTLHPTFEDFIARSHTLSNTDGGGTLFGQWLHHTSSSLLRFLPDSNCLP